MPCFCGSGFNSESSAHVAPHYIAPSNTENAGETAFLKIMLHSYYPSDLFACFLVLFSVILFPKLICSDVFLCFLVFNRKKTSRQSQDSHPYCKWSLNGLLTKTMISHSCQVEQTEITSLCLFRQGKLCPTSI